MADTSYLPLEIIEIVLLKLSAKSLIRFKTVSKTWNTIISNPVFVETHLQRSRYSNLFLSQKSLSYYDSQYPSGLKERYSLVKFEDKEFQTLEELAINYRYEEISCSCDGVLLLTNSWSRAVVLWNPSIRRDTRVWFPCNLFGCDMSYGVCRHPTTNDFKVVVITPNYYAVFSCTNKSWSKEYKLPYIGEMYSGRGVGVNGAIYWILRRENDVEEVIYFDSRDENLKMLQKPEHVEGGDGKSIHLVDLRGRLCLYTRVGKRVQIWRKEEGLDKNYWEELMTIDDVKTPGFELLGYVRNNKILIRLMKGMLVVYDPSDKTFEKTRTEDRTFAYFGLVPYLDSFLFPA